MFCVPICVCIYVCICSWLLAIWEPSKGRNLGVLTTVCIYLLNFPFSQLDMVSSRSGALKEGIKLSSSTKGGEGEPPVALSEGQNSWLSFCLLFNRFSILLLLLFSPSPLYPYIQRHCYFLGLLRGVGGGEGGVCGINWVYSLFFSCSLKIHLTSYVGLLSKIA